MPNLLQTFIQEQSTHNSALLLAVTVDYTVADINDFGCHLLGYSRKEIIGKDWFNEFLPQEEGRRLKATFGRLMNSNPKRLERFQSAVRTSDGTLRLVRWQNKFVRDDSGNITGVLKSGQDVTGEQPAESPQVREEVEKRKLVLTAVLDAQEKERKQIAYELHENVSQMITTCKLLLETEAAKPGASAILQKSTAYLQQVINEIRAISHWLNPSQLVEVGLAEAIRTVIQERTAGGTLRVDFTANDETLLHTLHPDIQLSLFRIVQEQLNNVLRHSQSKTASIRLHIDANQVELEIHDEGIGFNPALPITTLGLSNIKSRTENHNGVMYLESIPGDGCTLSICIPLDSL